MVSDVYSKAWCCKYMIGASCHRSTEYYVYCPTIVVSVLSSLSAKCPEPLSTTLDTMDGQRGVGYWQKGVGHTCIHTIHTYAKQNAHMAHMLTHSDMHV